MVPPVQSIQLTLGLNFVRSIVPSFEGSELPEPTEGQAALENVVEMGGQYRWLAVKSTDTTLQFDPGARDPVTGYPVAPFSAFLDGLLSGLTDPDITYTVELFLMDHILVDGQWIRGFGHIFRLLANGDALRQEARIVGLDFDVEILISVRVIP